MCTRCLLLLTALACGVAAAPASDLSSRKDAAGTRLAPLPPPLAPAGGPSVLLGGMAPENDECANAILLNCPSDSHTVDNTFATTSPDDPEFSCYAGGGFPQQGFGTIWYKFVASDTAAVINTCASEAPDTVLAVYAVAGGGCPCAGDLDGDCTVGPGDLGGLLSVWGTSAGDPGFNPDADLDGDGQIGPGDLGALLSEWGCTGTADPCLNLVEIGCNEDANCGEFGFLSQVIVTDLTPGETYYIQVAAFDEASLGVHTTELVCLDLTGPPPNDECENAIELSCPLASVSVVNVTATINPADPLFSCHASGEPAPGAGSVWYKFTASQTAAIVSTCGSPALDSVLAVYRADDPADPCATLVELACNDDACGPSIPFLSEINLLGLTVGETYWVQLAAFDEDEVGQFTLELTCYDPKELTACCLVDGTCQDVTQPECTLFGGTWQGPGTSCADITCATGACCLLDGMCQDAVTATFCDLLGGVYQGDDTSCADIDCPLGACCLIDQSCIDGVTPEICTGSFLGAYMGDDSLCADVICPSPPENDTCDTALEVPCNSETTVNNIFASTEPTDPVFSCHFGGPAGGFNSIWFRFTATADSALLSTCGSPPPPLGTDDTLIGVYAADPADPCNTLVEIGCSEDAGCGPNGFLSEVCVTGLTVGQEYYVQVAAFGAADAGETTLTLQCPCPAAVAPDEPPAGPPTGPADPAAPTDRGALAPPGTPDSAAPASRADARGMRQAAEFAALDRWRPLRF